MPRRLPRNPFCFAISSLLTLFVVAVVGVGASCRVDDEADRSRAANRIASRRTIRQDVGRREINQHSDSFETLFCFFFIFVPNAFLLSFFLTIDIYWETYH
jgi:hypothetical protein